MVEGQEELPDEQRVPLGLLNDEPRQRGHLGGVGLQGVAEEPGDFRKPQWRERQAADLGATVPNVTQRQREGVHGVHLVVAIGANEEEPADPVVGQDDAKEAQRRGVGPLEVVQEKDDDVVPRAEGAQELHDRAVESVRCFGRPELGRHGLWADDQLEVGKDVEDHLGVRCERLVEIRGAMRPAVPRSRSGAGGRGRGTQRRGPNRGRCAEAGRTSR